MSRKLEDESIALGERLETLRRSMTQADDHSTAGRMRELAVEEAEVDGPLAAAYEPRENWS